MGHRVVKRVPMDFDWPTGKVWDGYLCDTEFPLCATCGGDGQTPEARAVGEAFYAFDGPESVRWSDKVGQAEVNHLWEKGRLNRWDPEARKWEKGETPPLAADVNAANRRGGLMGDYCHDGINRWILVSFRCERLGIVEACPTCAGHGDIATDEDRARREEWEPTEPPTGDGWQLWETTSEGSPTSPVFASAAELSAWCADNATPFANFRWSADEWLQSFTAGTTDMDTLMVVSSSGSTR